MRMKYLKRFAVYFVGMILLAAGIVLNSKTNLGVSPIVSVAFCVSVLRGSNFANMTMAVYFVCFLLEMAVKRRRGRWIDVLQLPFCWIMTRFISFFSGVLPELEAWPSRIIVLLAAILLTGMGIALMVSMRLVPNPTDGLVQAVSDRTGRSVGLCKNVFDALCVTVTLALGLLASGHVIGVGIGTVAAVILTGRAVALTMRVLGAFLKKTAAAAPLSLLGQSADPD